MRPDIFLATIGRGSNGSNALEVTEDRAAVTAESQDNIINRVNNVSQYGPSWHYVPGIGVAGTAYAEVPGTALGDLAFTRASSKTRTNAAGVVETIGNNVPPHDYRNADGTLSTFPRLNLEPQRTNLVRFSEQINNAAWGKLNVTVSANQAVGPDGTTSADLVYPTTTGADRVIEQLPVAVTGQTWTSSFFVKASGFSWVLIYAPNLVNCWFNASTGVFGTIGSGATAGVLGQVNGYWRIFLTGTLASNNAYLYVGPADANGSKTATANGTNGILIWGCQLELGAYPTSYIPTTTAAVTRIADSASKTGVSSLIGQTEGTLFAEFDIDHLSTGIILAIGDGTANNRFVIQFTNATTLFATIRVAGANADYVVTIPAIPANGGVFKMALGYKTNDYVFALNGVIYSPSTASRAVPACSVLFVGMSTFSANQLEGGVNQAALLPTRLTNDQLAELTAL